MFKIIRILLAAVALAAASAVFAQATIYEGEGHAQHSTNIPMSAGRYIITMTSSSYDIEDAMLITRGKDCKVNGSRSNYRLNGYGAQTFNVNNACETNDDLQLSFDIQDGVRTTWSYTIAVPGSVPLIATDGAGVTNQCTVGWDCDDDLHWSVGFMYGQDGGIQPHWPELWIATAQRFLSQR